MRADYIFVCGRPLSRELKQIYPMIADEKITAFSPGVNLEVFQTQSIGIKQYDFVSTRLLQQKYSILPILDAFVALKKNGIAFKAAIVIAKPDIAYLELVKTKVEQALLEEVEFLPELSQEKISALYNTSRFSLHFPPSEGIGLSVVESALCECFPITLGHAAYMDYMDATDMIIARSNNASDLLESMMTALRGDFRVSQSLKQRLSKLHSSTANYARNLVLISATKK